MTEDQENRAGALLAEALYLERDEEHPDRWKTAWGTKTNVGLVRTILAQIEQAAPQTVPVAITPDGLVRMPQVIGAKILKRIR